MLYSGLMAPNRQHRLSSVQRGLAGEATAPVRARVWIDAAAALAATSHATRSTVGGR